MERCNVEKASGFTMPPIEDLIAYYSGSHGDWYSETIDLIIEENEIDDEDRDEAEKEAIRIGKRDDRVFGELYGHLKETIDDVSSGSTIFRILGVKSVKGFVDDLKSGCIVGLGEHWTLTLRLAKGLSILTGSKEEKIVLEATVDPNCVDLGETFSLWDMYPHEHEINLKSDCKVFLKGIHHGKSFIPINDSFEVGCE